eukprot:6191133-Pleurochrysis_carterae.AAC.1
MNAHRRPRQSQAYERSTGMREDMLLKRHCALLSKKGRAVARYPRGDAFSDAAVERNQAGGKHC